MLRVLVNAARQRRRGAGAHLERPRAARRGRARHGAALALRAGQARQRAGAGLGADPDFLPTRRLNRMEPQHDRLRAASSPRPTPSASAILVILLADVDRHLVPDRHQGAHACASSGAAARASSRRSGTRPRSRAVEKHIEENHPDEPFSHLAWHAINASRHHQRSGASQARTRPARGAEFLTRAMRRVIDEDTARLESGLTVLASVGSTAPFVGLFGTVWGVYHALVAIGLSGQGTLDKVAGPGRRGADHDRARPRGGDSGGARLQRFVRANRLVLARLDAFAHDLYAVLTTGAHVGDPAAGACRSSRSGARARAPEHGLRRLQQGRQRRADGGDQHDPAHRRDAGAAGDLHHHRAAAHARGEGRPAQGVQPAQHHQAGQRAARDRSPRAASTGTARCSTARLARAHGRRGEAQAAARGPPARRRRRSPTARSPK